MVLKSKWVKVQVPILPFYGVPNLNYYEIERKIVYLSYLTSPELSGIPFPNWSFCHPIPNPTGGLFQKPHSRYPSLTSGGSQFFFENKMIIRLIRYSCFESVSAFDLALGPSPIKFIFIFHIISFTYLILFIVPAKCQFWV